MATYLDKILVAHRRLAAQDPRDVTSLRRAVDGLAAPRDFAVALRAPGLGVIAEIKRRSPSKGPLAPDLDPAELGGTYEGAGAAALSVLTDAEFFGGSFADLEVARAAVSVPVLRKDFTVCVADVLDARLHGADAVLLIVAALDDHELAELHATATDVGLDVLVEVHDEAEVDRALGVGASLIGVNQRDLMTFAVDPERAERVIETIPAEVVAVAESGVRDSADASRLATVGFDAILVGEHLVTADDVGAALRSMTGHRIGVRRGVRQ